MVAPLISGHDLFGRRHDPNLRILDVRHRLTEPDWGASEYAKAHLPGSVHAHIDKDLSSTPTPRTGRHPLPDPDAFRAAAGRWGIDEHSSVVVYDDQGGIWAARAWWLLRDYGHKDVALLNGGIQAWLDAGGTLTAELPSVRATTFRAEPGHAPRLDAPDILNDLGHHRFRLVDARAPERFRGETEPIDPVAGHIPGAASLPALSLVDATGRFLPTHELRHRIVAATLGAPAANVAAYCGSGVTGCQLVLAHEAAGLGTIRLYPGSWSEWIRDPKRPVAKGPENANVRV